MHALHDKYEKLLECVKSWDEKTPEEQAEAKEEAANKLKTFMDGKLDKLDAALDDAPAMIDEW